MWPKQHETTGSGDLFRARLEQIINMKHELVRLAGNRDATGIYSDWAEKRDAFLQILVRAAPLLVLESARFLVHVLGPAKRLGWRRMPKTLLLFIIKASANRRVWTRMHVGGKEPRGSPYPDLVASGRY